VLQNSNEIIQNRSCRSLGNVALFDQFKPLIRELGGIEAMISLFHSRALNINRKDDLLIIATSLSMLMIEDDENQRLIYEQGMIPKLIDCFLSELNDTSILALKCLTKNIKNAEILCKHKYSVERLMEGFSKLKNEQKKEKLMIILKNLTVVEDNKRHMVESGIVGCLVKLMDSNDYCYVHDEAATIIWNLGLDKKLLKRIIKEGAKTSIRTCL